MAPFESDAREPFKPACFVLWWGLRSSNALHDTGCRAAGLRDPTTASRASQLELLADGHWPESRNSSRLSQLAISTISAGRLMIFRKTSTTNLGDQKIHPPCPSSRSTSAASQAAQETSPCVPFVERQSVDGISPTMAPPGSGQQQHAGDDCQQHRAWFGNPGRLGADRVAVGCCAGTRIAAPGSKLRG